ncbi:hypothetical protein Sgly_1227 [Syntrophobotulus glycolicus DSM 8271]|uniref:DUF2922 domain-containing protein n=1 Tax=Syntrophobotulus glycolicus (strain DSM 8271 / FlGlyR) TaxID=645991 RepID=F0SUQ0_SYNGF|nr:DUF2922 domain-containing protein [Syntrophobotulus glycolicus]ADY55543.1 hypothetical protein Sgly_1227 [Syntrophobotulus glycolicus DSM 8271]
MAVTTDRALRLSFTTAGGKTFSLTVPQPRQNIQAAEVLDVVNGLIAGGIFLPRQGALTGVKDIKVIETITDDLYDEPQG